MGRAGEWPTRLVLKLLQLLSTGFVVAVVARTGPQWVLLLATLVVPPFGIFLLFKSPDRKQQLLPHQMYSAVTASRRWLRVDVAICLTMFVIFTGFGSVLLYGYKMLSTPDSPFLLLSAIGALFTAAFYLLNAFVAFSQLRIGTIDFSSAMANHAKLSHLSKLYTPPHQGSPLALHIDTLDRFHQSPLPYPGDTLLSIDNDKKKNVEPPNHFQNVSLPRLLAHHRKSGPSGESHYGMGKELHYVTRQNDHYFNTDSTELSSEIGIPMTSDLSTESSSPEPFQVYDVPPDTRTVSPVDLPPYQDGHIVCRSLGQPFRRLSLDPSSPDYYHAPERINNIPVRDHYRTRLVSGSEAPYCAVTTLVSVNNYAPTRMNNGPLSLPSFSAATRGHYPSPNGSQTDTSGNSSLSRSTYTLS